jgi:hypothetical protein
MHSMPWRNLSKECLSGSVAHPIETSSSCRLRYSQRRYLPFGFYFIFLTFTFLGQHLLSPFSFVFKRRISLHWLPSGNRTVVAFLHLIGKGYLGPTWGVALVIFIVNYDVKLTYSFGSVFIHGKIPWMCESNGVPGIGIFVGMGYLIG